MKIILGVTGSVAAIKTYRLYNALIELGDVRCVLTDKGKYFVVKAKDFLKSDRSVSEPFTKSWVEDTDEWMWNKIGDLIPHIDLRDWADCLVIAPLSANTMAKMAYGICDNLITSIYRAWPENKNIIVAPAMNTQMWENPITREHLYLLNKRHLLLTKLEYEEYKQECVTPPNNYTRLSRGLVSYVKEIRRLHIVQPVKSKLACGTEGIGAMAPLKAIVEAVKNYGC